VNAFVAFFEAAGARLSAVFSAATRTVAAAMADGFKLAVASATDYRAAIKDQQRQHRYDKRCSPGASIILANSEHVTLGTQLPRLYGLAKDRVKLTYAAHVKPLWHSPYQTREMSRRRSKPYTELL